MSSNAVKLSQLIDHLDKIRAVYGDLDVVAPNQAADRVLAVQLPTVVCQAQYPWRSLIRPVLSIEPTDEYQALNEDSEWRYDLAGAPEGVTVRVLKRRGGEDTGYRDADGKWHVFEGGSRAWEVAGGGILAWRGLN